MSSNPYETKRYLDEYLLFHYGKPADICPFEFVPREWLNFHERLRTECLSSVAGKGPIRALDIGCAVGRFSFELSRVADEVIGIDNSKRFIEAARRFGTKRSASIRVVESGGLSKPQKLTLPKTLGKGSVHFAVGDAMKLKPFCVAPFQIVTAINLLCRLPSPARFLEQLGAVVEKGGQLILASPYSWLEQYTPRREWVTSAQVERKLRPSFRVAQRRDLPFLIREHRRKYQLVISEVTTFARR